MSGPLLNLSEYESFACSNLPKMATSYYSSGANDMLTLKDNREAFNRLVLKPNILVNGGVDSIDLSTSLLGDHVSMPICIAPTAMQKMAHPDGELATVRAASTIGTLMALSSMTTCSLEDVSAEAKKGPKWFQLYVFKDKSITLDLITRAELAGYSVLAITVDTPLLGRRESDIANQFTLPTHLQLDNFTHIRDVRTTAGISSVGHQGSGIASFIASQLDKSLCWNDIEWVRKHTTMKIVLKGVMTVEAALQCVQHGVDGIWISNHGARQLDTVPATIEVLPDIARAVAGRCEIYIDGGITRGTDVLKCLALGAKAVFLGRPVLWGLAKDGEAGVVRVLELLSEELQLAMQLCGCPSLASVAPTLVQSALSMTSKL